MSPHDNTPEPITSAEQAMVLASLEPEQLAGLKRQPIARRRLTGLALIVVWSLRLYLLFMMVVVIYQVWASGRSPQG